VRARGPFLERTEAALAQALIDPGRLRAEPGGELLRRLPGAREVARDEHGARAEALLLRRPSGLARLLTAARRQPHLDERARTGGGDDHALDVRGGLAVAQHPDAAHARPQEGRILPGLRFRPGSLSAKRPRTMRAPTSPMSSVIHGWCSVPTAWWCETVEPRSTKVCWTAFFAR